MGCSLLNHPFLIPPCMETPILYIYMCNITITILLTIINHIITTNIHHSFTIYGNPHHLCPPKLVEVPGHRLGFTGLPRLRRFLWGHLRRRQPWVFWVWKIECKSRPSLWYTQKQSYIFIIYHVFIKSPSVTQKIEGGLAAYILQMYASGGVHTPLTKTGKNHHTASEFQRITERWQWQKYTAQGGEFHEDVLSYWPKMYETYGGKTSWKLWRMYASKAV